MIDVVADEMSGSSGDETVHIDSFRFAVYGDGTNGVNCIYIVLAVPPKLAQPDIILRIHFRKTPLRKRYLAVWPKDIIFYSQLRQAFFQRKFIFQGPETAAKLAGFYDWPSGKVCF